MKKALAHLFMRIFGWKVTAEVTPQMKHSVMIAAPHTSNWDFPIALAAFWIMGVPVKFFIKDNYTKGPFGWCFKALGAIGVNRENRKNGLVNHAIQQLKANKELVILVPAEGTRKRVDKWKLGFYHIALGAEVPISLGYLNYKTKEAGVADVFSPSGDLKKDLHYIQETYRPISGKYPALYNPDIF
jgi:1-acyl-sn-glycerol-3-phosphate acyltransferase